MRECPINLSIFAKTMILTAVNISKEEAEAVVFLPSDSAFISIGEEHEDFWDLRVEGDNVLRTIFSDITLSVRRGGKQYNPMNPDQAEAMAVFIGVHRHKKFIVNCRAGISRSAAVCLFISQQYGHSLKPNFWRLSYPNPWVLQCLQTAQKSLPNYRRSGA